LVVNLKGEKGDGDFKELLLGREMYDETKRSEAWLVVMSCVVGLGSGRLEMGNGYQALGHGSRLVCI
jgi:hypothetical protein